MRYLLFFIVLFSAFPVKGQVNYSEYIVTTFDNIIAEKYIDKNVIKYAYKVGVVVDDEKELVYKRQQDARFYDLGNNVYLGKFYLANTFYKENEVWYNVDYATTTSDYYFSEKLKYYKDKNKLTISDLWFKPAQAVSENFYPDSGDGDVYARGNGWSTVRLMNPGTGYDYSSVNNLLGWYESGVNDELHRLFLHFNTSTIDDTAIISSSTFYIKHNSGSSYSGSPTGQLVPSRVTSNTVLSASDYQQLLISATSSLCTAKSITNSGWTVLPLNQTGTSSISVTGYTKMSLILGDDFTNTTLTAHKYARLQASDSGGSSDDPYLAIEYTVPPPPTEYVYMPCPIALSTAGNKDFSSTLLISAGLTLCLVSLLRFNRTT